MNQVRNFSKTCKSNVKLKVAGCFNMKNNIKKVPTVTNWMFLREYIVNLYYCLGIMPNYYIVVRKDFTLIKFLQTMQHKVWDCMNEKLLE